MSVCHSNCQIIISVSFSLTDEHLTGNHEVQLKSGGFAGVENLQVYIPENMTKNQRTEIETLAIFGIPMSGIPIPAARQMPSKVS